MRYAPPSSLVLGGALPIVLAIAGAIALAAACGYDWTVVPKPTAEAGAGNGDADWYVSVNGDDESDGSQARPVRSLGRALELARAATDRGRAGVQRIAVCAGEYDERRLAIQGAIEVYGSYDCASWVRPPVGASPFEPTSRLVSVDPADVFVSVEGNAVGSPRLEQLSITTAHTPIAVAAVAGEVTLSDLSVTNTSLPLAGQQVAGVGASNARLTLERSTLVVDLGGLTSGPATALAAAVGALDGSTLTMRRNTLRVSQVRGLCGAVVVIDGTATLEDNTALLVNCSKGASNPNVSAAIGLSFVDAMITSRRNAIFLDQPGFVDDRPNPVDPVDAATIVAGVNLVQERGTTSLDSDSDRVVGPKLLGAGATSLTFEGFLLNAEARVVNASVLLDSRLYVLGGLLATSGITVTRPGSTVVLAHNTFYFSESQPSTQNLAKYALALDGVTGSSVTLEGNLALTAAGPTNLGMTFLRIEDCESSGITKVANNRFGGFRAPLQVAGGDAGCRLDTFDVTDAGPNVDVDCDGSACEQKLESISVVSIQTDPLRPPKAAACPALVVPWTESAPTDGTGGPRNVASTTAGAAEVGCE